MKKQRDEALRERERENDNDKVKGGESPVTAQQLSTVLER
jgi:hypothetical protein